MDPTAVEFRDIWGKIAGMLEFRDKIHVMMTCRRLHEWVRIYEIPSFHTCFAREMKSYSGIVRSYKWLTVLDAGTKLVDADLVPLRTLKQLDLTDNLHITDKGIMGLDLISLSLCCRGKVTNKSVMTFTSLRRLSMTGVQCIGDEIVELTQLRALYVDKYCKCKGVMKVTNAGIVGLKHLRILHAHRRISDAAIDNLEHIIDVSGLGFSDAMRARVSKRNRSVPHKMRWWEED